MSKKSGAIKTLKTVALVMGLLFTIALSCGNPKKYTSLALNQSFNECPEVTKARRL
jgi:hypothetical protein